MGIIHADEILDLAKPMTEYLRKNHRPEIAVIISADGTEIMQTLIPTPKRPDTEWRRFELLTEDADEIDRFTKLCERKNLSREDLARILFTLRVRPGFGKEDFNLQKDMEERRG